MWQNNSLGQAQTTRRAGFTLIELLVVIAIISLLAAILFPVFGRAREMARRTSCASNLKQIGTAFEQYKDDYDSYYPGASHGTTGAFVAWPTLVQPYAKNEQVFVCPSASKTRFKPEKEYFPKVAPDKDYCGITNDDAAAVDGNGGDGSSTAVSLVSELSYARNLIDDTDTASTSSNPSGWYRQSTSVPRYKPVLPGGNASSGPFGRRHGYINATSTTGSLHSSQVEDPAGTIHMVDALSGTTAGATTDPCRYGVSMRQIRGDRSADYYLPSWGASANTSPFQKVSWRHSGGFNALYGDGHVKWRKFGSTKREEWSVQMG